MTTSAINANLPQGLIDPATFSVEVYLQIACDDTDQILSRPVGAGFTPNDCTGEHVKFSGQDGDVGAIPASATAATGFSSDDYDCTGYCECVELALSAKSFEGHTISLGTYGSVETVEAARAAIALPVNMILANLAPQPALAASATN